MPPETPLALHVCCAPCLARTRTGLTENAVAPGVGMIFFENPNIHPLLEFRRRIKALHVYLERDSITAEIDSEYGLKRYLAAVMPDGKLPANRRDRCYRCYAMRFGAVAAKAKGLGFSAFSTTLLASREQDRDLVRTAATEISAKHGLEFVDGDFRSAEPPEKLVKGLYRQQYCGCVFSEYERYRSTNKHQYFRELPDIEPGASET